jgi:pyruvate dehydrogenase E1 component
MRRTLERAEGNGLALPKLLETDYVNTIPTAAEPSAPGDEAMERRITAWNRWNAAAMVTRGAKHGVGGHIATFASAAWLYETGFNHFFKGKEADGSGDQLYIQGHASPGIYARAFLDGRLTEAHLDNFRQEAGGNGLPSYPHPRRLPWLWEFPTVSMGLGPLSAIYQARFNRYLTAAASRTCRSRTSGRSSATARWTSPSRRRPSHSPPARVWTTSPSSSTATSSASTARSARTSRSCRSWRPSSAAPAGTSSSRCGATPGTSCSSSTPPGALVRRLREVPDAQVQTYQTRDAAYIREDFFGKDPALVELAKLLSDDKILECFHLSRGGHEASKVYAAYKAAVEHKGAPDGHPGADGQGPHARPGLRVEERQPPDEEAVDGRVQADA